ncbi:MAG: L-seryl-tRNA(Sec) selenium transferase [Candidatus Marinimicrobia bacterium CG08_land_8_20_14_0_20_45_22]|nr:MAG: L-seryl-tRNA(Sec) selenium transferase [Candidatus Marinimicrobia bacterium CG08_land_8_20_14_0_20_45_22]
MTRTKSKLPFDWKILPSVQSVADLIATELTEFKPEILIRLIRFEIEWLRADIVRKQISLKDRQSAIEEVLCRLRSKSEKLLSLPLKKVINATGIVLHTGLGRAPFGNEILLETAEILSGFSNLEFDLNADKRGERLDLADDYLKLLTGAESSAVVNNNAAAVFLALNSLANRKEVIVSRGELIEIGGSFRLPEIMKKSGVKMVEVGTTNRTYMSDYESAIGTRTGAIILAHPSNYKIQGFTTRPEPGKVVKLAHEHGIPVIFDIGSGALFDIRKVGLPAELVVPEFIEAGVDLVTFSGDKLLGGPQCGIIVGKKKSILLLRKNPLMRIVRCDKTTFVLLCATLKRYLLSEPEKRIQTYRLLARDSHILLGEAEKIVHNLPKILVNDLGISVLETVVEAGSGSLPTETIPSAAIVFSPKKISVVRLAGLFRKNRPPVIGYTKSEEFYLDLKAVSSADLPAILDAIRTIGMSL